MLEILHKQLKTSHSTIILQCCPRYNDWIWLTQCIKSTYFFTL